MPAPTPLPQIGAPAMRALADVGIVSLDDLRDRDLDELSTLHGISPKAIRLMSEALAQASRQE